MAGCRTLIRVAAPVFAVALVIAVAGVGGAAQADPKRAACVRSGVAAGKAGTSTEITAFIAGMRARGGTRADIARALAADWCLRPVGTRPSEAAPVSARSDGDGKADAEDVRFFLDIYLDDESGAYYAYVDYEWRNRDYMADAWGVSCRWNRGIGGMDAFAVRLSGGEYRIRDVVGFVNGDRALDSYDGDYPTVQIHAFSQVNQYGAGITRQDNVRYISVGNLGCVHEFADMDVYGGFVGFFFNSLDGACRMAQVFGTYVHTWSSTSVTGIGAGRDGFSIQWASEGQQFVSETEGPAVQVC